MPHDDYLGVTCIFETTDRNDSLAPRSGLTRVIPVVDKAHPGEMRVI